MEAGDGGSPLLARVGFAGDEAVTVVGTVLCGWLTSITGAAVTVAVTGGCKLFAGTGGAFDDALLVVVVVVVGAAAVETAVIVAEDMAKADAAACRAGVAPAGTGAPAETAFDAGAVIRGVATTGLAAALLPLCRLPLAPGVFAAACLL